MGTVLAAVFLSLLSVPVQAQGEGRPNVREGFWIGLGPGVGSIGLDCSSCIDDRLTGLSGFIRMGGTISPHFLLGGEAIGWTHSNSGTKETIGFAAITLLAYPGRTGAFYLKIGLGGMTYRSDDGTSELTAKAPALSLGLGYDIRVARNFSIVPFLDSFGSGRVELELNNQPIPTGEDIRINLVTLGVGVTWH